MKYTLITYTVIRQIIFFPIVILIVRKYITARFCFKHSLLDSYDLLVKTSRIKIIIFKILKTVVVGNLSIPHLRQQLLDDQNYSFSNFECSNNKENQFFFFVPTILL